MSRPVVSSCSSEDRLLDLPLPALIGRHQIINAGTAVVAALALGEKVPPLAVDERAIETGSRTVEWPARMQRLIRARCRRSSGRNRAMARRRA